MTKLDVAALHLSPQYLERVRHILQQHLPNAEVWAYGSRVNGRGHDASDLDLVLRNTSNSSDGVPGTLRLRQAFEESDLPVRVDLVEWADIPERFRQTISACYIPIQTGEPEAPRGGTGNPELAGPDISEGNQNPMNPNPDRTDLQ
ncbi:MAG: nucleotidyltransferase domain-containing protein [Magnetococcales bacterium]|nr:nucleotidyltransferase domain-containing protein [Magnetococcales bacterium]MBF0156354.1 nucleotidyltransferase domain-containing protein [Magnetococcales bacterium]